MASSFFSHALAVLLGGLPTMLTWRAMRKWKRRADFWFERTLIAEDAGRYRAQSWESITRDGAATALTASQLDELIGARVEEQP